MNTKLVFFTLLLTWVFSATACATGSHSDEHGKNAEDEHQHIDASRRKKMSERELDDHAVRASHHGEGHQHADKVSRVGQPALSSQALRTIRVSTKDTMQFKFSSALELKDGEIIKFVVTNEGSIPHEFSIGDELEQQAHRKMMQSMPSMKHQDGNTITIEPGETKELTWQFKAGKGVVFACNIPGHYEAGMFTKADVSPAEGIQKMHKEHMH